MKHEGSTKGSKKPPFHAFRGARVFFRSLQPHSDCVCVRACVRGWMGRWERKAENRETGRGMSP